MANDKDKENKNALEDEKKDQGDGDNQEVKEKSKKSKLVRVTFNKSYTPYVQGETAGLDPELADKLIADKICSKS
ncbi:MAG: hypothetical protein NT165_03765 [Candidatus Falkowbacteria bacterium]|nr:hypothetical protein [Candidatus Falkowbacteria bacterium]